MFLVAKVLVASFILMDSNEAITEKSLIGTRV